MEGLEGVVGYLIDWFSRTNGCFFKRRAPWLCGHGARTAWLHAHSLQNCKAELRGYLAAHFVAFGLKNDTPFTPVDTQVTHTTLTRRSALYTPLSCLLGVWGPCIRRCRCHCCWFWRLGCAYRSTVPDPRSGNIQTTQTMPA